MSEYYYIMAEAKLNGTWYNIDPWIKKMNGEFALKKGRLYRGDHPEITENEPAEE